MMIDYEVYVEEGTCIITNDGRVVMAVDTGEASCHSCVFFADGDCTRSHYLTPRLTRCGVNVFHEVKDE